MTERFAIYYAPARDAALAQPADAWLAREDLSLLTVSARRYGFHATLKAPMRLADGYHRVELTTALADFARRHAPVSIGQLDVRLVDGFLALTPVQQSQPLTNFAATVVTEFDRFRAPLSIDERKRRLNAPLTARQTELVDSYGYPYVLEQFRFHMTLTDRIPAEQQRRLHQEAEAWFAEVLDEPLRLDRLVLFQEADAGAAFQRLDDFVLEGRP